MTRNLAEWVQYHSKNKTSNRDEESRLVVTSVETSGDASVLGRLGDLGLSSGEMIFFFGVAPLGEPVYISVRETVIALRLGEAALIHVKEAGAT